MIADVDDFYCGLLDDSFDANFAAMKLPWLPWVGCAYRQSEHKTIILGESIYDYGKGKLDVKESILKEDSLRRRHMRHGIQKKFNSAYVRNFERAVFLKKRPSDKEREQLWIHVIYHNLVARLLPSLKSRPTFDDYTSGWVNLLELVRVVQATRCIVYGLEPSKINALGQLLKLPNNSSQLSRQRLSIVGRNRPTKLTVSLNGQPVIFLFIRHPSSFFSWRQWGSSLREHDMMPLRLPCALPGQRDSDLTSIE